MLKPVLLVAILTLLLAGSLAPRVAMAGEGDEAPPSSQQQGPIDDNDDTRVEVQLVVLGIAAATVVGAGITAYLVRRKLGLTEYDPAVHRAAQGGDAHH